MEMAKFLTDWKTSDESKRIELAEKCWYDWFCSDSSLYNRTKKFVPVLKKIAEKITYTGSLTFDGKNCCPLNGPTYDVLRIWDEDDKLVVGLTFDNTHADFRYEVFSHDDDDFGTDNKDEAIEKMIEIIKDVCG